ncbi:MAG: peptidase and in kexin sedolisin [Actinomycetia bacterium]|jgi:serine protease AprX|nr:peptidase and in kexin sedolisin [Actinomycetes bacterium]MDQ1658915.1 serine protease AprX [Cryptosporangiaceae bacterium]
MSSSRRKAGAAIGLLSAVTVGALLATAAPSAAATTTTTDWSFPADQAAMTDVARIIHADTAYAQGYTGKGVGVALIDTGVVPVQGLTSGNIVNGPDLSIESQIPSLYQKDGYGHGTHMAGIIAGRDNTNGTGFRGIAPDAKLTSIKVGAANGAVDVSQMLAAVDWVVAHRNDDPRNPIRVLNLSYGTDGVQDRDIDPLVHAAQTARKAGLLVVVAAGNSGATAKVSNPAIDRYALVVGATDHQGTTNPMDDTVSSFSSRGDSNRMVDLLAPGRSIVSLRAPGSYIDTNFPAARVGDRYFKGSGSSEAAAVVSGAAALLFQRWPSARPQDFKAMFQSHSIYLPHATSLDLGYGGQLDLAKVLGSSLVQATTPVWTPSAGNGTLQGARGTGVMTFGSDTAKLTGEIDIFGLPFNTAAWAAASTAGTSWSGGTWMGRSWTGTGFTTAADGMSSWTGRTWSGRTWSGRTWSSLDWSGRTWSGRTWSSASGDANPGWCGASWQGLSWSSGTRTTAWLL